ncbi:MAG: hypothetical protein OCD76_07355 [Reichenbachiella sp.]
MPRSRGDKEYALPSKGLNTEANLLHFPQEFSPDLLNMEIDYNPQVVRPRKGINTSGLPRLAETRNASAHDVAISSYLWEAVGNDPDKNFVVVQVGRYVYFFDDEGVNDPTASVHSERIDLNDVLSGTATGTIALAESTRLDYAVIKGKLLFTSKPIDPTIIQYDGTNITIDKINLKQRDMLGIDDGLKIDEHPATLTDDHSYNLLNQGWYKQRRLSGSGKTESDPIAEYETQWTGEYPSNADIVWVGMVDSSGDLIFDAEYLRDQSFGSTPAPRGHYVVDIFNIDRDAIITTPSDSGATSGGSSSDGSGADWDNQPPVVLP